MSVNVAQILCFYSLWANAGHVLFFHSNYCKAPTRGDTVITLKTRVKAGLTFPGGRVNRKYFQSHLSFYKDKTNKNVVTQRLKWWGFLMCTFFSFPHLSNHHPAHSCTQQAGMFHISEGHARQPTQRGQTRSPLKSEQCELQSLRGTEKGRERQRRKSGVLDFLLHINDHAMREEELDWGENE